MADVVGVQDLVVLLAAHDPTSLSDDSLLEDMVLMQSLSQAIEARKVADLREAEARRLPSARGSAHVIPWAASTLKVSPATVSRLRKLGRSLPGVPVITEAFATGRITSEQAQVMADTVAVLPAGWESEVLSRGIDLGRRSSESSCGSGRRTWTHSEPSNATRTPLPARKNATGRAGG